MYTTYHLASANEISSDIIDAIKLAFKDKSIVLTIEEEIYTTSYLLSSKKIKIPYKNLCYKIKTIII